jgi:hypothetical protein
MTGSSREFGTLGKAVPGERAISSYQLDDWLKAILVVVAHSTTNTSFVKMGCCSGTVKEDQHLINIDLSGTVTKY